MCKEESFEEQFPSLKGKAVDLESDDPYCGVIMEVEDKRVEGYVYLDKYIEKHCLDSQKVKEILEKHDKEEPWPCLQEVIKELGI